LSWTVHCAIALIIAFAVWIVWAKPVPHSLKAGILCVGVVTVTPYLFPYDFCILSIAVAFLVNDGLSRGFLLGERTLMLFLIALRIVAYRGDALAVPLPSRAEVDHPPL